MSEIDDELGEILEDAGIVPERETFQMLVHALDGLVLIRSDEGSFYLGLDPTDADMLATVLMEKSRIARRQRDG